MTGNMTTKESSCNFIKLGIGTPQSLTPKRKADRRVNRANFNQPTFASGKLCYLPLGLGRGLKVDYIYILCRKMSCLVYMDVPIT